MHKEIETLGGKKGREQGLLEKTHLRIKISQLKFCVGKSII